MPRYVDHAERRRAIVKAAWALIADEGYEAVTIRRLAQELGGATGRITNFFSTKDDILIAVLDELTASHQSGLAQLSAALDGAGADLDLVASAIVESLPLDDDRIRDWKIWLVFWSRASISPVIAQQHQEVYAAWRDRLASALSVVAGSDQQVTALQQRAEQLLAFIDGLGVHLLIEPDRAEADAVLELVYAQLATALAQLGAEV
ncbi:MAG: TetR family transcriptional regulator [Acidimicrobiaceae bacterium]|jgi:AcrR family transcriptional regulator|nr:TetR family transcriptional regulator [Acidimicrobiaceae bacterium]MBT5581962.1 TetR family transcriptional regulator [Acidimicrobiaceae bacterium]MBT5849508.1 TetR family transcriptional regulator [Acidimicrobiaceae bacterium]